MIKKRPVVVKRSTRKITEEKPERKKSDEKVEPEISHEISHHPPKDKIQKKMMWKKKHRIAIEVNKSNSDESGNKKGSSGEEVSKPVNKSKEEQMTNDDFRNMLLNS